MQPARIRCNMPACASYCSALRSPCRPACHSACAGYHAARELQGVAYGLKHSSRLQTQGLAIAAQPCARMCAASWAHTFLGTYGLLACLEGASNACARLLSLTDALIRAAELPCTCSVCRAIRAAYGVVDAVTAVANDVLRSVVAHAWQAARRAEIPALEALDAAVAVAYYVEESATAYDPAHAQFLPLIQKHMLLQRCSRADVLASAAVLHDGRWTA
jgi:hypothetical protein